ncbi:OmpP1/FadL family transporter [Thiocystis violacea]|uniref:OmpP1/FadL family transporter n=1 Tax=Thiocystis violacea TaxID=13725 RepID=UPI001903F720|nr:outer membrane protein transport protein [Thiocystis violacea]MBK1721249.1 aromatic hydrocarbon degradation protein [Thiocystis violacea]
MINCRITRSVALLFAAGVVGIQAPVQAGGFMLPETSVAGIGTTNAMVANPEETGAFSYNAAAMGFHDSSSIALGALLISPDFSVETASGTHDSQGADWLVLPMIQAALKVNEQWRLGFGISTPFGLETRWRDGTFPAVSGTRTLAVPAPLDPQVPLGHPTTSQLEVLDFSPTATYRVNADLSLSAGMDVYWTKTAKLNSTAGSMSGDGTGLGFNLGALYRHGAWSFGASYRSSSTVALSGDYVAYSSTLVYLGRQAPSQRAELDFDLPWRLQLGARYAVNPRMAVEVDVNRTGWSAFNDLKATGNNTGAVIFADQNDWDDANAYRLGLTYQVQPQTQLRFGYTYDETGQGDDHFSARVPDNDRHLFGLGLAQSLGQGYTLEAAYLYVMAVDRDYRGSRVYTGSDLNGSTALNGDYAMDAHLIGLQVTKTF